MSAAASASASSTISTCHPKKSASNNIAKKKNLKMETPKEKDRRISFGRVSVLQNDDDDSSSLSSTASVKNNDDDMEYEEEKNGDEENKKEEMEVEAARESIEEEQDPAQTCSPFNMEISFDNGYFQGDEEAEEARQGCYASGVPKLEEWEELKHDKIELTVGAARDRLWYHTTKEISMIKTNIDNLVVRGIDDIALQNDLLKVYKFLFGTDSNLCRIFESYLYLSKDKYLMLLRTFFLSCKNKQNVYALSTTFDIQHQFYLDVKSYNKI